MLNVAVTLKRIAMLVAAAALLAPAAAQAKIIEIGQSDTPVVPSCPRNCNAVSRTTGYQAKVGTNRGLMTVPQDGRIVAWTITLSKPGPSQVKFFQQNLGGESQAGIAILRPAPKLFARTVSLSPIETLTSFFGQTVQFPLDRSLVVHKGDVIGLQVPTWAPALAVNQPGDTSWRAARSADKCRDTQTQTATKAGDNPQYRCLYRTARLAYSATLVTNPGT